VRTSTLMRKASKGEGETGAQRAEGELGFLLATLILAISYEGGIKSSKNLRAIIVCADDVCIGLPSFGL